MKGQENIKRLSAINWMQPKENNSQKREDSMKCHSGNQMRRNNLIQHMKIKLESSMLSGAQKTTNKHKMVRKRLKR